MKKKDGLHVFNNGTKVWYLNGKKHREGGPAIEYASGTKYWFLNNEYHREDGPAIEHANGSKYWYLNNKELTEDQFKMEMCLDKFINKLN